MDNYVKIISQVSLFQDFTVDELGGLLKCLSIEVKEYNKGDVIFRQGDIINVLGIVIEGGINLQKCDYYGNNVILTTLCAKDIFGESYAGSRMPIPIEVVANQKSKVAFVDYDKVIQPCSKMCYNHNHIVTRMIELLATKNILLTTKIDTLSKRTTREKILDFLANESVRHHSREFTIPFNRQGLADYLVVDRSALSAELSKLKQAGIIDFHRDCFKILKGS
ncbi:MAG: Crp/Fnr family transcriptional regulator [Erysipelotrichaceae bacterium]|nr:Crp/Fnr family transcriptional regulator [Erysipelotrichaceae bacterium]MDD3809753.1 Crp/Fnr family transcriptional regulator [Erysipelotrichaceae bacterium]